METFLIYLISFVVLLPIALKIIYSVLFGLGSVVISYKEHKRISKLLDDENLHSPLSQQTIGRGVHPINIHIGVDSSTHKQNLKFLGYGSIE